MKDQNEGIESWEYNMERIRREIRESKGFNNDLRYRISIAMEDAEDILAKKRNEEKIKEEGKVNEETSREEEEADSEMGDEEFELEDQLKKC
jgi:hypothetical protein